MSIHDYVFNTIFFSFIQMSAWCCHGAWLMRETETLIASPSHMLFKIQPVYLKICEESVRMVFRILDII